MALLPTGSDALLTIQTANVDIVIKSKGRQIACVKNNNTGSSSLKVVASNLEQVAIPVQNLKEEYIEHRGIAAHEYIVSPLFFEQTDYLVTIRARNKETLEFRSNSSLIENGINRVLDEDPTLLSGIANFGNNVGFSDFIIYADGRQVVTIQLEVYPTKISYKEDYQAMMADINDMVSESILDFMKKTYQIFDSNHTHNDVPAVFFTVLKSIYANYIRALNRILQVPHHKLITEHEILPHYKVSRIDRRSERWLKKHPEYVRKKDGKIQAEKILAVRKQITYDTQENRLVKFMLKTTIRKIDDFSQRYKKSKQQPDAMILDGAAGMSRELQRLLSTTFLSEVSEYSAASSMSLIFGMAPGYRELYKYYLMLQNGITVGGEVFHMSVRDTAILYEYWCFIKLYDILRSHYTLNSPDIIKVDRSGVTVDLMRGKTSKVEFLNTKTREHIILSYNPSETETQTVNQKPDNVLELEKKGSKTAYKYVFDAKYRIEMNPDGKFYPDKKPGPKMDDINTMHRYRDSIVYENKESRFTFEKTMFGAYILFPYADEAEYKNHRFYKSIENVNIGGLPFLPSATSLVTNLLDELISDSPESAFERTTLPAGIEDRLKSVNWDKREVLIGYVPDQKQLMHYLGSKKYFTSRFDIANLPVHYVALYEKEKGIYWYGEVISWEKVKRSSIPGTGNQRGHEFKVLGWKKLTNPIHVAEYAPNPISYTNFFLLSHCSSYSELLLKSEADYRFFTELKRRTNQAVVEGTEDSTAFEFGKAIVQFKDNSIYVYRNQDIVEECTVQEFVKRPNATFRRLQKYVEEIGEARESTGTN